MELNEVADVATWRRILTRSFPLAHYQPAHYPILPIIGSASRRLAIRKRKSCYEPIP